MIWTTAREAAKPHQCSSCLNYIKTGARYLELVASPNHGDLGNTGWWRIEECGDCARRYGRGDKLEAPIARAYKCDECGRFTKASELQMVFGPMPEGGPDHEACLSCRARRRNPMTVVAA